MSPLSEDLLKWLSTATPTQFLIGFAILVFGGTQILSKENLSKSLGGLSIFPEWLSKRREREALERIDRLEFLEAEVNRLLAENLRQYKWSHVATRRVQQLEGVLVREGIEVPDPPLVYLHEFRRENKEPYKKKEVEEGEGEDE